MNWRYDGYAATRFRLKTMVRPHEAAGGNGGQVTLLVKNAVRTRRVRDRRPYRRFVREQSDYLDNLQKRLQDWANDRGFKDIDIKFLEREHRLAVRLRCSEDVEIEIRDFPDLVVLRDRAHNGVAVE